MIIIMSPEVADMVLTVVQGEDEHVVPVLLLMVGAAAKTGVNVIAPKIDKMRERRTNLVLALI